MKIQLHHEAAQDINKTALWYEEHQPGLGAEFLEEVRRHLLALRAMPETWPKWPGIPAERYPVRRRLLGRFPYGIAYQVVDDRLVVVAIAADKQRPHYWASRAER